MSLPFRVGRDQPLDITRAGQALRGRGPGGAGGPGGGARIAPAPVVFPPEVYPVPGSRNFYSQVSASVSNAAAATLASVSLLASEVARISAINLVITPLTTSSVITFSVRTNQGAVNGYGAITIPQATSASLFLEKLVLIRIPVGTSVIDVTATVGAADAATYTLSASLEGWAWDPALAAAYAAGLVDTSTGH